MAFFSSFCSSAFRAIKYESSSPNCLLREEALEGLHEENSVKHKKATRIDRWLAKVDFFNLLFNLLLDRN